MTAGVGGEPPAGGVRSLPGTQGARQDLRLPVVALSQLSRAVESGPTSVRCSPTCARVGLDRAGRRPRDVHLPGRVLLRGVRAPGVAELHIAKHRNGPTDTIQLAFTKKYAKFACRARTSTASGAARGSRRSRSSSSGSRAAFPAVATAPFCRGARRCSWGSTKSTRLFARRSPGTASADSTRSPPGTGDALARLAQRWSRTATVATPGAESSSTGPRSEEENPRRRSSGAHRHARSLRALPQRPPLASLRTSRLRRGRGLEDVPDCH